VVQGWRLCQPGAHHGENPFQDIMAQREMCGKGGASHAVVGVRAVECGSAATLHGGGIEMQHGEAEAVSESSLELPALEFKGSCEREGIQPGRCGATGTGEESGTSTLTVLRALLQGGQQGTRFASEMVPMLSWDSLPGPPAATGSPPCHASLPTAGNAVHR
jgi:hypothetical protein